MRRIGLTGGIATGKSTVSNLFKANGFPVVDADVVARVRFHQHTSFDSALVSSDTINIVKEFGQNAGCLKKGSGGWRKVVAAFGDDILLENGEVDRPKLGQIVFGDPSKRQLLNRLLGPYISYGIFWEVLKLWLKGCRIIILDVPLLFEAKMDRWTNPIIVVWVDPETQLKRLMTRDRTSAQDAQNRISAQMPLDLKRSKADIVIDNNGSLEELNENFKKILDQVTKPLTWTEFLVSRQGAIVAIISIISGVLGCKKLIARL